MVSTLTERELRKGNEIRVHQEVLIIFSDIEDKSSDLSQHPLVMVFEDDDVRRQHDGDDEEMLVRYEYDDGIVGGRLLLTHFLGHCSPMMYVKVYKGEI